MDRETLNEYLITYEYQTNRIESFDQRIEELAFETEYVEKVKKLVCFLGVKTHTALSCRVETGDFQRFAKENIYTAYLGLVPGEDSSSDNINRLSITKAGNSHLRPPQGSAREQWSINREIRKKGRVGTRRR